MGKLIGVKGPAPTQIHKIQISIDTNGFTKFLKISDVLEEEHEQAETRADKLESSVAPVQEIRIKMVDLQICELTLSLIHRKSELLTLFVSKLQAHVTDTQETQTVKFSVGYLQLDNQSETDPAYPVLLKPKILEYDAYARLITLRPECEMELLEKENKGKQALGTLRADDFKTFQLQLETNKELGKIKHSPTDEPGSYPEVLYVDHIIFWLQTLEIKIQFSHLLKIANYLMEVGKILNKSVHLVHYVFLDEETSRSPIEKKMKDLVTP